MPTPEELDRMTREQRDRNDKALSAVARAVTDGGGEARFLHVTGERWPRLRGAQVADVLEMTVDRDMFLPITEPFFEAHEAELPPVPAVLYALHALIILDGIDGARPPLDRLMLMLAKAGFSPRACGRADGQAGRDDQSGDWPERLRPRYRSGFREGRLDLVRQAEHAAQPAYDPVPDLAIVLAAVLYDVPAGLRREDGDSLARLRRHLGVDWSVAGRVVTAEQAEAAIRDALNAAQAARIVTRTGRVVTEADIEGWAEEAERGYDICGECRAAAPAGRAIAHKTDCSHRAGDVAELALSDDDSEAAADAAGQRASLMTEPDSQS